MLNQTSNSKAKESAEDIFFGQISIIWARWFLIAAGTVIALWSAIDASQLTLAVLTLVALMGLNFFAHGRYITGKPVNQFLLLFGNLLDVTIITLLVIFWSGQTGLKSNFFILYYPMLLAWALVFPPSVTFIFSLITLVIYAAACLLTPSAPMMFSSIAGFETLVIRLITLGAMAGLGTYYYRRQRDSLRALTAKPLAAFK